MHDNPYQGRVGFISGEMFYGIRYFSFQINYQARFYLDNSLEELFEYNGFLTEC